MAFGLAWLGVALRFKPLLSNKVVSNEKITILEDDCIVENDFLNEFFSSTITTLGIPKYNETEPVSHNICDPLMKAIIKYKFHPNIIVIKENCNSGLCFSFSQVKRDEIMKEINNPIQIKPHKAHAYPTKLIKANSDIFGDFIFGNCNDHVSYSVFPNSLKNVIITPVHKKVQYVYS